MDGINTSLQLNNISSQLEDMRRNVRKTLTPDKVYKLKKLRESEVWSYVPEQARQQINLVYILVPDLFEEPEAIEPEKTSLEKEQEAAIKKAAQAELTMPEYAKSGTAQFLQTYGFLPQGYFKMSPGQKAKSLAAYPLQKVLSLLQSPERMAAVVEAESYKLHPEQPKMFAAKTHKEIQKEREQEAEEFMRGEIKPPIGYRSEVTPKEFISPEYQKESWKEAGHLIATGAKAFVNMPGEYQDYCFSKAYKTMYPDTPFTRKFGWGQRFEEIAQDPTRAQITRLAASMLTGLAGSPADIAGFVMDNLINPLTYLGGGKAPGAVEAGKAPVNFVDDAGRVIIPKGAYYRLSGKGNQAIGEVIKNNVDDAVKTSMNLMDDGAKISAKLPGYMPELQLRGYWTKKFADKELQKTVSKLPYNEAITYFDLGGIKIGSPFAGASGTTIVPGYELQKITAPIKKLGEKAPLKQIQQVFRPSYGIPEEVLPGIQIAKHWGRSEIVQTSEDLANAIYKTGLGKDDLNNLAEYMQLKWGRTKVEDLLAKNQAKQAAIMGGQLQETLFEQAPKGLSSLKKAETNLLNRLDEYDDLLRKITPTIESNPKLSSAAQQTRQLLDNLANDEKIFGSTAKYATDYFPTRYTKKSVEEYLENIKGKKVAKPKYAEFGIQELTFEKTKKLDYLYAKSKGLVPEDFVTAISRRTSESAVYQSKQAALNEIKKFAIWDTKTKGFAKQMDNMGYTKISSKVAPELKGFYVPKEVAPMYERMVTTFFGDDAFRETVRMFDKGLTLWKRMALATPGYQFRNFWTDTQLSVFKYGYKYFEPKYWKAAKRIASYKVSGDEGTIKLANLTKPVSELYDEVLKGGIAKAGITRTEARLSYFSKARQYSPFQALTAMGEVREDITRIVPYLIERDLGSDMLNASFNVRKLLFDYSWLTPTEKNVAKRVIPFYSWVRKNLALQPELLITEPGKYHFIPATISFIESMGEELPGYEQYKRDYQKKLGAILLPIKDPRTGQRLLLNPNFAWQEWANIDPTNFLSSMRPLLKIPIELGLNKEIFTGAPTKTGDPIKAPATLQPLKYLPNTALAWFGMKKNIDGTEVWMSPLAYYAFRQNPILANLARVAPADPEAQDLYDFLSITLGLKCWLYDEDKQKEQYFTNYKREIDDALSAYRKMGYRLPELDEIEKGYKMIFAEEAAKKTNIAGIEDLLLALQLSGAYSQTDIYKLSKALEAPYEEEMAKLKGADLIELERLLKEMGIVNPQEEFYKRFPEYQRVTK